MHDYRETPVSGWSTTYSIDSWLVYSKRIRLDEMPRRGSQGKVLGNLGCPRRMGRARRFGLDRGESILP